MSKAVEHLKIISKNDLWETPTELFRGICAKLDFHPGLDVCATAENSKCAHFIAEEDDALTMEWKEDFFANVPYSQVRRWIEYGLQQVDKHRVTGLFLTFAKTDSRFFHAVYERPNRRCSSTRAGSASCWTAR